jgi:hypothetical protein
MPQDSIVSWDAEIRLLVDQQIKQTYQKLEEWCLLGCYAVWLL